MTGTLRAFVAIDLPVSTKADLAGISGALRAARVEGLRPVSPEGVHLTLKFLGDISRDQVKPIVAQVSRVAKAHNPFSLALGGVDVFSRSRESRVLWVGVEGDLLPLLKLHHQVDAALEGLGFVAERRQFSPHLTVARIGRWTSSANRQRARDALLAVPLEPGHPIRVRSLSLMRTILAKEGATYQRLALVPLGAEIPKAPFP